MSGTSEPGSNPAGRKPKAAPVQPRMAQAADRRAQAFKLKKAGVSNQDIAEKLGVTRQAVGKMLRTTMSQLAAETAEDAKTVRVMSMARLEDMMVRCYQKAVGQNPDLRFMDRALKIVEMQLKISGAMVDGDEAETPEQQARDKAAMVRGFLDGMMATVPLMPMAPPPAPPEAAQAAAPAPQAGQA